jgi:hypothetical protein
VEVEVEVEVEVGAEGDPMVADMVPMQVERGAGDGLWTLVAPPRSLSKPVVTTERVHVLVHGRPTACNRADGTVLWQSPYHCPKEEWMATLAPAGGPVVVVSGWPSRFGPARIRVTVLDGTSGAVNWQVDTDGSAQCQTDGASLLLRESALADRGTRTGPDWPTRLTVLDLADGARLWQHTFHRIGSVALAPGRVLAKVDDMQDYTTRAFDARTGTELWHRTECTGKLRLPNDGRQPGEPLVIVWRRYDKRVSWLSVETGEEIGEFQMDRRHGGKLRLTDDGHPVWLTPKQRAVHASLPLTDPDPFTPTHVAYGRRHTLLSLRNSPIATADGWLYTIDRRRRLVGTRIDGDRQNVLRTIRQPRHAPGPAQKAHGELPAGPHHVYAHTEPTSLRAFLSYPSRVVALRHGQVLWQLPRQYSTRAVPAGDQVLITDLNKSSNLLRMVDSETGAFAGPPGYQPPLNNHPGRQLARRSGRSVGRSAPSLSRSDGRCGPNAEQGQCVPAACAWSRAG